MSNRRAWRNGLFSKVVSALVEDIINPVIGLILGSGGGLAAAVLQIGPAQIKWGHLVSVLVDFIIVSAVVYFGFKGLGLEKFDKKA